MNGAEKALKFKIYQDELKLRHTTHWDLDYLGAADYEGVMKGGKPPSAPSPELSPVSPRASVEADQSWLACLLRRFGRR